LDVFTAIQRIWLAEHVCFQRFRFRPWLRRDCAETK
jgi:hypothetical protein